MTLSLSAILEKAFRQARIAEARVSQLMGAYEEILADILAARMRLADRPMVLGVCGSQGSGKTTMTGVLEQTLREAQGLSVAVLSLDDLYLSSIERAQRARDVHPLLRTRGVPGTHDVELGRGVIDRLLSATSGQITQIPRFDKSRDEPCPVEQWESFRGRPDLVIFEGWCVGAVPQDQAALLVPVNELERDDDPDGRWRRYVNEQLAGSYRPLFALLDQLLMLRAPAFEVVFEWRREQERKLAASAAAAGAAASGIMSDAQLRRFIMHYERLTRHILAEMPARADLLVALDGQRQITAVERRTG